MHSFKYVFSSVIEKPCEHMHIGYPQSSFLFLGSLESVTDVVGKYRLRSKDGTAQEVGTNDKKVSIQLNGLPFVYKGTHSFIKAAS